MIIMDLLPLLLLASASFAAGFVPTSNVNPPITSRGAVTTMMAAANNNKKRGGRRGKQRGNDSIGYGIGLGWEEHWEKMYQQLVLEKSFHSDAEGFKLGYVENTRLWFWLHIQKENLRRGVMRQDRKQKLMDLGYQVAAGDADAATTTNTAFDEELMLAPTPPPVTNTKSGGTGSGSPSNSKKWLQEFVRELQFAPKPPPVTNSAESSSSNVNWLT